MVKVEIHSSQIIEALKEDVQIIVENLKAKAGVEIRIYQILDDIEILSALERIIRYYGDVSFNVLSEIGPLPLNKTDK